jgi:hypothetical protein
MKKRLLRHAVDTALGKLPHHPELNHFPHFSFVVARGRIMSWATNTKMEPPKHYGYHRPWDGTYRPKFHAEVLAYRRSEVVGPFEIINVRLNRNGDVKLSRPCVPCCRLLGSLGCRRIWFSSEVGFLSVDLEGQEM